MTYNYHRRRMAIQDVAYTPYSDALTRIQEAFVGEVAQILYQYVKTLHKRLSARPPWDDMSFFLSWDYGSPKSTSPGVYQIPVWMKSGSIPKLGSTISITLKFDNDIHVTAKTEETGLLSGSFPFSTEPSQVGMAIGERWERELTGRVEWANDEF